ncbi:o-succinylbenzoate synthase [Anditalea andensis]|uniref:Chloromuconate cycloisomerase n=1 Tax=Anditalea andensis TaxID=1048983 RepID=A0A074L2V7_9BACT|nr:o-succinylbenzoate synthase [Anditalea andensis]KEO74188.1 chloromuconate cycloisomerase [Anditalea andensis]
MSTSFRATFDYSPLDLTFKFDAGTSRGILKAKTSYIIKVNSSAFPTKTGFGEAGPLPKLSIDDIPDFETVLENYITTLEQIEIPGEEHELLLFLESVIQNEHPSIRFAFETALLDLINGGKRQIFDSQPLSALPVIPINGLIWMGDRKFMLSQIDKKLQEGYTCVKMKIGAIDFNTECELLGYIRKNFSSKEISLRVDANGAFNVSQAMKKLEALSKYDIHSIEQPIKQGNWEAMADLCARSPVSIALDEELIGINDYEEKARLLHFINPSYIILKPTLLGGIKKTLDWITIAEKQNIAWWMTSALESNIGLNVIYQLTSRLKPSLPQGLGTGQLYEKNIDSPLRVHKGNIHYDQGVYWEDIGGYFK